GTALGKSDEAKTVLADLDKTLADQAAAHPELAGKTVVMTSRHGVVHASPVKATTGAMSLSVVYCPSVSPEYGDRITSGSASTIS
ncbi:hypothetical protein ACC691_40035, partial [Rhizobium johnstonii]|uniref:hypothetical protein n=1 Tax=Rhizobium johnstonii TaxID=3019933 RepID=UPI003F94FDB3